MSELNFSVLDRSCLPLWKEAFGDSTEYIEKAIGLISEGSVYAAIYDGGSPISQCILLEKALGELSGLYIYAACTSVARRGEGLFSKLIEGCASYAEERGYDFLSLIPASGSLADYYKKRGFTESLCTAASPAPSEASDFYLSIDESLYSASPFDGNYERIYATSDRTLSVGSFQYTCESLSEVCETVYVSRSNGPDGFVVRCRDDRSKIFCASSDLMRSAKITRESAIFLIRPIGKGFSLKGITSADPVPR